MATTTNKFILMLKYVIFCGCFRLADAKVHVDVRMYSDLITMVEKADEDVCVQKNNVSVPVKSLSEEFQPLILSQYTFSTMTSQSSCQNTEIRSEDFGQFDWSCFTTGSDESRDINWFFVDCFRLRILSVKCLETARINAVIKDVCDERESTCRVVDQNVGDKEVCSKIFEIKKQWIEPSKKVVQDESVFPSRLDVIAYICAVFILVSFIVSVVVLAEKCRPRFGYDDDSGLRVPLEIYELYGQHYKPSERRKAYKDFTQDQGSISYDKPYLSHLQNVAVLANHDSDSTQRDRISSVSTSVSERFYPGFANAWTIDHFPTGFKNMASVEQTSSDLELSIAVTNYPFHYNDFTDGSQYVKFEGQRSTGLTVDSTLTGENKTASFYDENSTSLNEYHLSVNECGTVRRSSLC